MVFLRQNGVKTGEKTKKQNKNGKFLSIFCFFRGIFKKPVLKNIPRQVKTNRKQMDQMIAMGFYNRKRNEMP